MSFRHDIEKPIKNSVLLVGYVAVFQFPKKTILLLNRMSIKKVLQKYSFYDRGLKHSTPYNKKEIEVNLIIAM